ncbi:MAG: PqqD family protein [Eubacteriales bacterium]|nr:PqqD family protein [Eubacteriales bacterium]
MKKKVISPNYLEKIPEINGIGWRLMADGNVELEVENKGFFNRLAQKFFHKPKISFIKLDAYGSFVWQQIDGKRSLIEIGRILGEEHEGATEKLYERLSVFFEVLKQNGYIRWK